MKREVLCGVSTLLLLSMCALPAEAYYRRTLTISRPFGAPALNNVQALVELTPGNFDYSHVDPSGAYVRFTDADGVTALPYYRETWNPGGTSTFWVRVPSVAANAPKTLYLYYATTGGNIDPTSSSFSATFPNAYVAPPGHTVLTPTAGADPWEQVDWFQVQPGSVLTIGSVSPFPQSFTVHARRVIVAGEIRASGCGYGIGAGGPGAGSNAFAYTGGGGGGYGGAGGDAFGEWGPGGLPYGSPSDATIHPGSPGGSTVEGLQGGIGGGAVSLSAHRLDLTGVIRVNGLPGDFSLAGGGGGSGGGVRLLAHGLRLQGEITAHGGSGLGDPWSGGGGGGGRIKVFHETTPVGTPPLLSATGGSAGPGAEPGDAGTIHVGAASSASLDYDELEAVVGSETNLLSVDPVASIGVRVSMPAPNPARGSVGFAIDLDRPADGEIEILDLQGRRVRTLAREPMAPGAREWSWDLRDGNGRAVSPGLFLARVRIADRTWTRRIVVAH